MVIMEEICEAFDSAETLNVYNDGVKTSYSAGGAEYAKILSCWNEMISSAHEMPALGVSLNAYTVEEMKKGLWLEFDYKTLLECNGMPFEKLLVKVEKENYGFNLVRYTTENGYDGRCFYLDLFGKNMGELYDLLLNL